MLLKKIALIGTVATLINLPLIAHADLVTNNHTSLYSTVEIDGLASKCVGRAGKWTGPSRPSITTSDGDVRAICGHNPCTATIVVAKTEADIKACQNLRVIGSATVNTSPTAKITELSQTAEIPLSGLNTNTLNVG